jgi:hypothetical protein
MKHWHWIERIAHWIGLFLAVVAIVAVGVIIGRPSEKSGNQPSFTGAEQQQKRLVVFLDGTWNSVNSNTNVWRMRANGTKLGRRRVEPAVEARILELKASGDGILKIGRKLGIGTSVVQRVFKQERVPA